MISEQSEEIFRNSALCILNSALFKEKDYVKAQHNPHNDRSAEV